MSARDDILSKIKKKASKLKDLRERTSRDHSYKKIILTFLEDIDRHAFESKCKEDYYSAFTKALQILYANMRSFCTGAGVQVVWDDPNAEWPKVKAIIMRWPPEYVAKNPGMTAEEMIDITDLLFDVMG